MKRPEQKCGNCRWLDLHSHKVPRADWPYLCTFPLPDSPPLSIYPFSVTGHPDFKIVLPRMTVEEHQGEACPTWEERP